MNKNENSEISEKNKGKSTAIKDIIEKLKAKKIEKEELGKKEKEAEEQSIMRRKIKQKDEKSKQKEQKSNQKNKEIQNIKKDEEQKNEERITIVKENNIKKIKNERVRDKSKRHKRSIDLKQENLLLPHKTFRDENDDEEINFFVKKTNNLNHKNSKEKNIRRKQLELDIKSEINKDKDNLIKVNSGRYTRRQRLNSNDIIPKPTPNNKNAKEMVQNTYKKPLNKISTNNRVLNVYRPKKPGVGATVRGRSLEKAGPPNLLLNKINNEVFNNSSNNIFSTINNNTNKNTNTRIT